MSIRDVLFDVAPEIETTDATELARIDRFITRAANSINRDLWGNNADEGTALLAAHRLTLRSTGVSSTGGQKIKEDVDDTTIEYARPGSQSTPHGETKYGRQFDEMASNIFDTPWAV